MKLRKFKTIALLSLVALASCKSEGTDKVKISNAGDAESIPVYLAGKGRLDHSMSEYRVITGKSMGEGSIQVAINSLQDQMKNAISLGWQPAGGISVTVDKDYLYTCSQAIVMIK